MSAEDLVLIASCDGGGNDTLAFLFVLLIGGLYAAALLAALGRAEDGKERMTLTVLLVVSITVGGLFFLYPDGIDGDADYLGRFVLSLVVTGLLGAGVVAKLGEHSAGRALFIALAGDILIPGGLIVLLFASFGIGTGCLD